MDKEEIYEITNDFVPQQWTIFARTRLKIEDDAMEEIDRKFSGNFPEKQYQTIKEWGKRSENDCSKLRQLKHDFFCRGWQITEEGPEPQLTHAPPGDDIQGTISGDDFRYTMTGKKGKVLIISNSFTQSAFYQSREIAAREDLNKMKELWVDKIGCKLHKDTLHPDKSAAEIKQLLEGLAKTKDSDYVVAVISTHGGIVPEEWVEKFEGENPSDEPVENLMRSMHERDQSKSQAIAEVMFGNDERPLRLRELKTIFSNASATELHNIPKFLILGYCRGNITDVGVLKNIPQQAQAQAQPTSCLGFLESLMPTVSDVLVAYSTHKRFKSFEDIDGTWLISFIADVFGKYHGSKHVIDMLTIVNRKIKAKAGLVEGGLCKAMSIYESSLVKDFHLM